MKLVPTKKTITSPRGTQGRAQQGLVRVQFLMVKGGMVLDAPPPLCFHGPGPSVGKLQDQAFFIPANVMTDFFPYNSISTYSCNSNIHSQSRYKQTAPHFYAAPFLFLTKKSIAK